MYYANFDSSVNTHMVINESVAVLTAFQNPFSLFTYPIVPYEMLLKGQYASIRSAVFNFFIRLLITVPLFDKLSDRYQNRHVMQLFS